MTTTQEIRRGERSRGRDWPRAPELRRRGRGRGWGRVWGVAAAGCLGIAAIAGCAPTDATNSGDPAAASMPLDSAAMKEIAMQLVSSAENSTLDWTQQYAYIEDISDGRGYTAGIIGFCSGTGDMLELVQAYTATEPGNPLAPYLPALEAVNGTDSHEGLDPGFMDAWVLAAADPVFQDAQDVERDTVYFDPSVAQAK
ncbi:MAG: chitosanase, partial [Pseudolysinimonas sp.]